MTQILPVTPQLTLVVTLFSSLDATFFFCSRHVLVLFEDRCTRISSYDELLFGMQLVSAMAIASALRETGVKTARIILLVR